MPRIISRQTKDDKKKADKEKVVRRLLWLLGAIVLVLVALLILPIIQRREVKAEAYACSLAVRRAQDAVLLEFLSDPDMTSQDAAMAVDASKLARDELCPSGGDYYLVPQGGSWRVTCGIHEEDTSLRTRINASRVLEEVQDQLDSRRRLDLSVEGNLLLNINGKALDVIHLAGDNGLRRGTDYSIDFEGVVCFFALNSAGDIKWFVYADQNHAAVWKIDDGWSGDAYPKS